MLVKTTNNITVQAPNTYLSNLEVAGTNVLRVKNINVLSPSWAIQLGNTGEAQAEIKMLGTAVIGGTAGTITGTTNFDHPADTPVYAIKYDQLVFERSTVGTAGTATPITGGTVNIMPNSPYTFFDDTTGASTYGYRSYYQNSVTLGTSLESDWLTSAGFQFFSLAKMRQRVKDKLVNSTYITSDLVIDDWINEWGETMNNTAIDVDEGYAMGTFQVAYGVGTELVQITQADFKQLRRVWYSDASGTYIATKMESNTFSPNRTFSTTYPYFYFEGDTLLGRKPSDQGAGTFTCEYYKLFTTLVNDTDTIPVNMQGYTKGFVNYALGQALIKDQKEGIPRIQEALADKELFKKEITPRNKTGATYVDIVEDTGEDSELWY